MNLIERIESLGIKLKPEVKAIASYVPAKKVNGLIYVSGQLPLDENNRLTSKGKLSDQDIAIGQESARQCLINALSACAQIIDLNEIDEVVQVQGFVQSNDDFYNQAQIINGASDLCLKVFEENGRHSRFAVGVNALPLNASVEISFIFSLK